MKLPESILRPVKFIRGGMHLNHHKNTAECESIVMPAPKTVYIPLSQHIGAPAVACVAKGDKVYGFASDGHVMVASIDSQKVNAYQMPFYIDSVYGITDAGAAVISSGNTLYLLSLGIEE